MALVVDPGVIDFSRKRNLEGSAEAKHTTLTCMCGFTRITRTYGWGLERKVLWEVEIEMEGATFVWTIRL